MNNLQTTDNKLVGIAIGQDGNGWYVQTADIKHDTYLSEHIQEGLECLEHALAIAELYEDKYGFKTTIWSNERVFVNGYGFGTIQGRSSDMESDYPIFVEFDNNELYESDSSGYFELKQLKFNR